MLLRLLSQTKGGIEMKKYVAPEMNMLVMESKDIVTFSISIWNDLDRIVFSKDKLDQY